MLIDTRDQWGAPDERPVWDPNWRLWSLVALAIGLGAIGASQAGLVGALLVLAAFVCACQALSVALPDARGMNEYKQ